ncbi:MAG: phosphatidate cytidylyltransferase [Schwartzia sp.]|nr:phosphatidate cytidylyltransferase [Schwartzia sp. (in: firmicutes)]
MAIRIISGVVGIALATFVIQTGGAVFGAATLLLMLAGWHEYAQAFRQKGMAPAYGSGMAAVIGFWSAAYFGKPALLSAAATLSALWMMLEAVLFHKKFSVPQALVSTAGVMYVGLSLAHLVLLRFWRAGETMATPAGEMEIGCAWFWIAMIGTWASDTFAYFSGSAFGRTKLCETISPKKTREGFYGGVLGTAVSVAAAGHSIGYPVPPMLALGVLIALVATMGDLVESVVKRYTGIKDSGVLIPGHGGVLDRFDSAMYVIPCVYYFLIMTEGFG